MDTRRWIPTVSNHDEEQKCPQRPWASEFHSYGKGITKLMIWEMGSSEQIPYEINCRTKPNESLSVIAYSGLSTEVSSVSSENATVLQKSSTTTNRSSTKRPVDGGSRLDANDATIATTTSVDHSNCEQKVIFFSIFVIYFSFNVMHVDFIHSFP
ncbi:unnamed protein product [Trichobilharzia regenti]|nr:unnamed protein product [Trichobilharzia regenti]